MSTRKSNGSSGTGKSFDFRNRSGSSGGGKEATGDSGLTDAGDAGASEGKREKEEVVEYICSAVWGS